MSLISPLPRLPERGAESHKGSFGSALLVGGSVGMSGAAALAGLGALRGGAGLVTVAVPRSIQPVVAGIEPSYLTVGLEEDREGRIRREAGRKILALSSNASAVAIGPGWGRSADLDELAHFLYLNVECPLVIDADGLNALAALPGGFPAPAERAPRIITPHPGEFARLTHTDTKTIQNDRAALAAEFAGRFKVIVVLKGHGTIITDGRQTAVNTTGNAGMATGGTGDVLTGLVTALIAQGMPPFDACRLAAHLHCLAGDLAAEEHGQPGLIASDLPRYLGRAWRCFEHG